MLPTHLTALVEMIRWSMTIMARDPDMDIARAAYRPGAAPQVIARNDMVRVTYQVGGVNLAVMGKAMRNAGLGEPVAIYQVAAFVIVAVSIYGLILADARKRPVPA